MKQHWMIGIGLSAMLVLASWSIAQQSQTNNQGQQQQTQQRTQQQRQQQTQQRTQQQTQQRTQQQTQQQTQQRTQQQRQQQTQQRTQQQRQQQTQQRTQQRPQQQRSPYALPALPSNNTVVATVNGEPIRADELIRAAYDWFGASVVEELILERIVEQEARKQNIRVSPQEVESRYRQQLQNAEAQVPPGMSLEDFLKRNQFPPSRLYARIRTQMLAERLVERSVNLDEFVEYSQIVVRIPGTTPEQQEENLAQAEAKAKEAYEKIKQGLEFSEAVKEYSEDPFSRDRGGKMMWQNRQFIVPDIRAQLEALKPGEVSEPFRTAGGFMIVRLERTGNQAPAEEQRNLREQAVRLRLSTYIQELQAKAKITNTVVKPFTPQQPPAGAGQPPQGGRPQPPAPRPEPR
ncbi:MAG: peptidylprolyl isomerase [Fimbriimonadales bacterium]